MKKITIYTTKSCLYCTKVKILLNSKKLLYEEICINNEETLNTMILKSNGRRTVPQIFIGNVHIGGYDSYKK